MMKRIAVAVALAAGMAGVVPATPASAQSGGLPAAATGAQSSPSAGYRTRYVQVVYYSGPDLQTEVGGSYWDNCWTWEWGQTTEWSTRQTGWTYCSYP